MTEIELKFQVPVERRAALAKAVATATARRVSLRARYFDTADRRLGGAGLALRVRKEGRRWVQTLKGAGDGIWQRLEHEVPLHVTPGVMPPADPALHDGTPAGDALRQALGDGELLAIYGTEVTRTQRLLRVPGCVVELAFDQGALTAGERRWPLCELEFELKSGEAGALVAVAARWVQRFGLTLDTRTKAERGDRLARGVRLGAPVKAQPLALPADVDCDAALRRVVGNCLQQVLGNASDLAHETDTEPEHLHQLRVGLRRLRTALRELGPLSPALPADWGERAGHAVRPAGQRARPRCAGADAAAGAAQGRRRRPAAAGDRGRAGGPHRAARERDHAAVAAAGGLCRRLGRVGAGFRAGGAPTPGAAVQAGARRRRALRRAGRHGTAPAAQARQAAALPERVRRRVCSARAAARLPEAAGAGAGGAGRLQRRAAWRARCSRTPRADDPMAMFALGWLAHERDDAIARCTRVLAPLRRAEPFWD